jgi:hypothetical protein
MLKITTQMKNFTPLNSIYTNSHVCGKERREREGEEAENMMMEEEEQEEEKEEEDKEEG